MTFLNCYIYVKILYDMVKYLSFKICFMCLVIMIAHMKVHCINAWELWSQKWGLDPFHQVVQMVVVGFYRKKSETRHMFYGVSMVWGCLCRPFLRHPFLLR